MAVAAMYCVQLGIAASIGLSARVGAGGVAWLRMAWAAVVLLLAVRPWRTPMGRSALRTCIVLGFVTAGMIMLFMAAVVRIPMGTASALEFLGPLGVALVQARGAGRW